MSEAKTATEIGAPYLEALHRHEMMLDLHNDLQLAIRALEDLSFSCDGVTSPCAPSHLVYNRTFAVLCKLRDKYSLGKAHD